MYILKNDKKTTKLKTLVSEIEQTTLQRDSWNKNDWKLNFIKENNFQRTFITLKQLWGATYLDVNHFSCYLYSWEFRTYVRKKEGSY